MGASGHFTVVSTSCWGCDGLWERLGASGHFTVVSSSCWVATQKSCGDDCDTMQQSLRQKKSPIFWLQSTRSTEIQRVLNSPYSCLAALASHRAGVGNRTGRKNDQQESSAVEPAGGPDEFGACSWWICSGRNKRPTGIEVSCFLLALTSAGTWLLMIMCTQRSFFFFLTGQKS
eukprot:SAG11_NODE_6439_length_1313_cov_2.369028_1_plen_173_part_10